jgi:uncharacterized OB-fold protein
VTHTAETGAYGLPLPVPTQAPELDWYWSANRNQQLLVPRCGACMLVFWYPRNFCPDCGSDQIEGIESAGTGQIYSFTVTRHGPGLYRAQGPYVVALVELDEGVRVMTNVVGCVPESVRIGQRVRAVFDQCSDQSNLLRFTPMEMSV